MISLSKLNIQLYKKKSELQRDKFDSYSKKLEALLGSETARVFSNEYLRYVGTLEFDPDVEDVEPSYELELLQDEFPSLLRASILTLVHGFTETVVYALLRKLLPTHGEIERGVSLSTMGETIRSDLPGEWISLDDLERLKDYMQLRHVFAHGGPTLGKHLRSGNLKLMGRAAGRVPGVRLHHIAQEPKASGLTLDQRWAGNLLLSREFIPAAIDFHFNLLFQLLNKADEFIKKLDSDELALNPR